VPTGRAVVDPVVRADVVRMGESAFRTGVTLANLSGLFRNVFRADAPSSRK